MVGPNWLGRVADASRFTTVLIILAGHFAAQTNSAFEEKGVICRMKAVLPESMPSIVPGEEPNGAAAA
jgi:hypothetical protein